MEMKEILIFIGGAGVVGALLYVVFEKAASNYFTLQQQNADIRESMLVEKINWLKDEITGLKTLIASNTKEQQQTRMKLQSLDHELAVIRKQLEQIIKSDNRNVEHLGKILAKMQNELDSYGNIIIGALPEKKSSG